MVVYQWTREGRGAGTGGGRDKGKGGILKARKAEGNKSSGPTAT